MSDLVEKAFEQCHKALSIIAVSVYQFSPDGDSFKSLFDSIAKDTLARFEAQAGRQHELEDSQQVTLHPFLLALKDECYDRGVEIPKLIIPYDLTAPAKITAGELRHLCQPLGTTDTVSVADTLPCYCIDRLLNIFRQCGGLPLPRLGRSGISVARNEAGEFEIVEPSSDPKSETKPIHPKYPIEVDEPSDLAKNLSQTKEIQTLEKQPCVAETENKSTCCGSCLGQGQHTHTFLTSWRNDKIRDLEKRLEEKGAEICRMKRALSALLE